MEFNINLSDKKSIKSAIQSLKVIQSNKEFDDIVVNKLVDKCYERCIQNLENMQHLLYSSTQFRAIKGAIIKEYARNGVGYVKIKSPAIFVEFGTGIVGGASKHPEADEMQWNYGKKGWVYPTDSQASNPNKIQLENGSWIAGTRGQPSRPFAYNASLYIKSIVKDEVKIAFEKYIKKGK